MKLLGKENVIQSNTFVAAAVRLEPVLERRQHQQQEKHDLQLLTDGKLERQAVQWRRT